MRFESQYVQPALGHTVSRDGKTFAFLATQELGQDIDYASEYPGCQYDSERIRACLIGKIEQVIQSS